MIKFCYTQEDEGFFSPTTYDQWESVKTNLESICDADTNNSPTLTALIVILPHSTEAEKHAYRRETLQKAHFARDKIFEDTNNRLAYTLNILRACRMFNYQFVRSIPFAALNGELLQLQHLPRVYDQIDGIKNELRRYKQIADGVEEPDTDLKKSDLSFQFFLRNKIKIPTIFDAAMQAALVMPSSATAEISVARFLIQAKQRVGRLQNYCCHATLQ